MPGIECEVEAPMNATQPTSSPLSEISVTAPLTQAIDRVKLVLFQPFDLGKWFIIGFCAWLAQLGEGGGGGNFNPGGGNHHGGNLNHEFEQAKDFVMSNLYWIIPVAVGVVLLCVVLGLLFTWLNSRGKFMFLHCVALNKAEVAVPWTKFSRQANSLFWFRIVLGLIAMVIILPLIAVGVVIGIATFARGDVRVAGVAGLAGVVLLFFAVALVFFLIRKFTMDFVVPIMFVRGCTCREGWGILRRLMSANVGNILLYLLFQIVIAMVTGMLVLAVMIVTCCCCCLLLLPYVSTVILLPVFVFHRAYSAHYLAQFGRGFDVFVLPAA